MQETQVQFLGREYPLEKEMATHFSIFIWRMPWTEGTGGYSPWDHRSRGDLETKPPPYVDSHLTSLRSAIFLTTQSKLPSGRPPGTPRSIAPSPFSNSLNDLSWKWSLTPLFCIWVWPCQASVFSVLCQLHLYPSSLFSLPSSKRERFRSAGCQLPVWSPADTVWVITTFFPLQSSSSKLASHFHLPVSHV